MPLRTEGIVSQLHHGSPARNDLLSAPNTRERLNWQPLPHSEGLICEPQARVGVITLIQQLTNTADA